MTSAADKGEVDDELRKAHIPGQAGDFRFTNRLCEASTVQSAGERHTISANLTRAAGVVLLLVGTLMVAATAKAEPFHRTFSGWGIATEIDTNGDGVTAGSGTYGSMGTFGPATTSIQTEQAPWSGGTCFDKPWIIEVQYAAATSIERFRNGDLLFSVLDRDPENPSTACFNLITLRGTATINVLIRGGTGRFEGATGWTTTTVTSVTMAGEPDVRPTHTGFWGSTEGEIFLVDD